MAFSVGMLWIYGLIPCILSDIVFARSSLSILEFLEIISGNEHGDLVSIEEGIEWSPPITIIYNSKWYCKIQGKAVISTKNVWVKLGSQRRISNIFISKKFNPKVRNERKWGFQENVQQKWYTALYTTVKPLLSGHLWDLPKCLLNRGL